MSLYDLSFQPLDKTVKIFDGFYNNELVISANQYEVVLSYFKDVCATVEVAENYTAVLFRIAQETDIDALTLLDEVKGGTNNNIQLTQVMAYYLNSFKSKTSLYGISIIPKPVQPVARNVVL
jgi:hypothetical protein